MLIAMVQGVVKQTKTHIVSSQTIFYAQSAAKTKHATPNALYLQAILGELNCV
jgi:hypothetical protein